MVSKEHLGQLAPREVLGDLALLVAQVIQVPQVSLALQELQGHLEDQAHQVNLGHPRLEVHKEQLEHLDQMVGHG